MSIDGKDQQADRALLSDCLAAFEAIPTAASARKMLKRLGVTPGAYAGNGSHLLANQMAKEIRRHLGLENPMTVMTAREINAL